MSENRWQTYLSVWMGLTLCFLIVSCTSPDAKKNKSFIDPAVYPSLVDQSWLVVDDETCRAPCWHGLKPGISSQEDAIALAQTLSFIEAGKELPHAAGTFMFPCKMPIGENCLALQFKKGILSDIWLYLNYEVTFEQVVSEIGPPDSFCYTRRNIEVKGCSLYVYWIEYQFELGYSDPSFSYGNDLCDLMYRNNNKFPKGILVEDVHYMVPCQIEEIIEIVQQPETGNNYAKWEGFVE